MQGKGPTNRSSKSPSPASARRRRSPKSSRQTAFIPDWRERVKVLSTRRHENRSNPKFDVLNADKWYAVTGCLSNRVDDLDAYLGPAEQVVNQIRTAMQRPGGGTDVTGLVETLSTRLADARQMLAALQALRDDMYAEIKWYQDELFQGLLPAGGVESHRRRSTRARGITSAAN